MTPEQQNVQARLIEAIEDLIENAYYPEASCNCHVAPPCHDCVEYGGIRGAVENARLVIKEAKGAK